MEKTKSNLILFVMYDKIFGGCWSAWVKCKCLHLIQGIFTSECLLTNTHLFKMNVKVTDKGDGFFDVELGDDECEIFMRKCRENRMGMEDFLVHIIEEYVNKNSKPENT